jgi:hypothetical protein
MLKTLPATDLIGLDRIEVYEDGGKSKLKGQCRLGTYYCKEDNHGAYIELFLRNIYRGFSYRTILWPFFGEALLTNVLFHEIGHHCIKTYKHGIGRDRGEEYAQQYANKYTRMHHKYLIRIRKPATILISALKWVVGHLRHLFATRK